MNYMVTGGAGFIGSNYVRMLLEGHMGPVSAVKVIDKLTYAGSLTNLKEVISDPRLTFHKGDICNKSLVSSLLDEGDILVNFAAESHVDRSIKSPSEFVKTNVLGTQVLLTSSLENKVRMFLHVSTDEVYGSLEVGSSLETDPLLPNSPYSASKAASDLLVRSYVQTFGLDARITRSCNNYGINQYPEKLIPLAIKNLKEGKKIPIYGDGLNRREWIHVEDHCKAIQLVITKGNSGEIYNIGSGNEMSNLDLVEKIVKVSDSGQDVIKFVQNRLGHDFRYSVSSQKIAELGFTAVDNLESTLIEMWKE